MKDRSVSGLQGAGHPTTLLWPALAAMALLVGLFPIPQPRMASSQPWRAELATLLVLSGLTVYSYLSDGELFRRIRSNPWVRAIAVLCFVFTLWGLLSSLWSHSPWSAWHHTTVWFEYTLCFLLVVEHLSRTGRIKWVISVFALVAAVTGVLSAFDYITLPDFKALEGILHARYSAYAELLVAILPVLWIVSSYLRGRKKILLLSASVLGWAAVMLSLSKGAFIAGIMGTAMAFAGSLVFGPRRIRRPLIISAALWLVVTGAVQIGFSVLSPIPATVDYISGKVDPTRNTTLARFFVWKVGRQMIFDHPLVGVGADNFGVAFNESRARFRAMHPEDMSDEIVSDFLVGRAHNEPLQVTAELGVTGLILFLLPVCVLLAVWVRYLLRSGFRPSPLFCAAVGGLAAFAISSMASSFSLRIVQNGLAAFAVAGIAVYEATRKSRRRRLPSMPASAGTVGYFLVFLLLAAMLATNALKGTAEYLVYKADAEENAPSAIGLYGRALRLDPDYAAIHLKAAGRYFGDGDHEKIATELRKAIDGGFGVVITYDALADSYLKKGDAAAAAAAYDEALRIFPRSVYLRVRYSLLLRDQGRNADADMQMQLARAVDTAQADGWSNLITMGSLAAFTAARQDPALAPPADLLPAAAVLQFLDPFPDDEQK